jgi:hypothetical protein
MGRSWTAWEFRENGDEILQQIRSWIEKLKTSY